MVWVRVRVRASVPLLERHPNVQGEGARDEGPVRGGEQGGQLLEHHLVRLWVRG